jgi:glycosyltransferase involved in cell wall biosynthesis
MRILVWQWGRYGTGARYALELAQTLKTECGHETLLSLAGGSELLRDPDLRGAVALPIETYSGAGQFLWRSFNIERILRPIVARIEAAPPDAAIVTMMGYWDIFLARHLRRMGVPVVVVLHDAEVHPGDQFHFAVHLQRRLTRMSEGVITLTDFVAGLAQKHLSFAGKVHATIPHVVLDFADLDLPAPVPLEAAPGRPLRLLMAGRLKRYKGLDLLAEALRRLDGIALNVRVVGAVQDRSEIETLAAIPGVEFDLGWKTDAALMAHLDWADACILPYVEASQSGVAPLAFKRGRPVIATPVGGLPEQIDHERTGLIAEAVSPEALAACITRLAQDRPLLLRCADNALAEAQGPLSWKALAPRFSEVLETVAQQRTAKS